MIKFIKWIVDIIKNQKQTPENITIPEKNEIDFLELGDITWAKRYKTEEEKSKIKEGHEIGPYIIIKKDNNKIYGIYCSSNSIITNPIIKRKLNKLDYTKNKDNYIWINNIDEITEDTFLNKIGKIDDQTLDLINKYIYIGIKHNYEIKNYTLEEVNFNYSIGDIIIYKNNKYYIHKIDNNNFYCYKLNKNNIQKNITIYKKNYSLDFNNVLIPIDSKISLYEVIDIDTQKKINKLKVKTQEEEKYKNNLESGNLIEYNNKLYYIFGNFKDELLTYKIKKTNDYQYKRIMINNQIYYTNFEEIPIKKGKEKIKVISRITPIEELELKKLKKQIKNKNEKKINNNKNNEIYKKYKIKTIILDNETQDKYIIINRENNIITVYSMKKDIIFDIDLAKENKKYTKLETLSNIAYQNKMLKIKKRIDDRQ